jgi:hypothetical protein
LHPARRDHDRQVVDEVAHHFVRRRSRPDDDAGAHLRDGDDAFAQSIAGQCARHQVFGIGVAALYPFQDSLPHETHLLPRQLDQVQRGKQPNDFKPMPSVGRGVEVAKGRYSELMRGRR